MGFEVEFAWKTQYFYLSASVKTKELGSVLSLASKANIIE